MNQNIVLTQDELTIQELDKFLVDYKSLEFVLIIHRNGLPIYTKNYSEKYSNFLKDKYLISGFFSAITNFPNVIGFNNKDLHSLDIGQSKFLFYYTENDVIIIVSYQIEKTREKEQIELCNYIMTDLKNFFETEFPGKDLSIISIQLNRKLDMDITSLINCFRF